jgi:hypothetical protein
MSLNIEYIAKNVIFLFPTTDLPQDTQGYYKIYALLVSICTVAGAVKAM